MTGPQLCKRRARNIWTLEQKTVLHALSTLKFDLSTCTAVFNEMFQEHLSAHGFTNGLRDRVLYAQYRQCVRDCRPDWIVICKEPSTNEEWRQRDELTTRIQGVAASLNGIQALPPRPATRPFIRDNMNLPQLERPSISAPARPSRIRSKRPAEDDNPTARGIKRTATGRRSVTEVQVSPIEDASNGPLQQAPVTATPVKQTRAQIPPNERIDYIRRNGPVIKLTPTQIEKTKLTPAPVPEILAHPPMSGLLFRYWDEHSFGLNSEEGFIAGRFRHNNVAPRLPKSTEIDFADVENHLDRHEIASPFISASNCLLWLIRLALGERNKGAVQGRITLVSTDAIRKGGVFWVKPFHRNLLPTYCFNNGAWRYAGTHEFMIWHQIPREAIISTFTVADLLYAAQRLPALKATLRIDVVSMKLARLKTTIVSNLQESRIALTPRVTVALAELCQLMGLSGVSKNSYIRQIIADVVQGWRVLVEHKAGSEWAELAALFTHKLCATMPSFEREQQLKAAFLNGVRAGLSDFNMLHKVESMDKMERAAKRVGLESPTKILLDAMANATSAILSSEQEEKARYEDARNVAAAAAGALLPGIENFLLESDVYSPSRARAVPAEELDMIAYDEETAGL